MQLGMVDDILHNKVLSKMILNHPIKRVGHPKLSNEEID
jgi:hypothetical protein